VTLERGARPRGKTIKRSEAKKREGESMKRDKIDKLIIRKQRERERKKETVVYQYFLFPYKSKNHLKKLKKK
jgi:hypothetical protein